MRSGMARFRSGVHEVKCALGRVPMRSVCMRSGVHEVRCA